MITVWEFRSIDGKQVVTSIRPMRDDDYKYVHEFQRIIYRGIANKYINNLKG